tara:strand:- start:121 stop:669 length:549 start_codon:yes stop_codon:yes gene_type:complete
MRDHSTDTDALIPPIGAPVAKVQNTITGFDAAEDVLLIEVPPGVDATVTGQRVTPAGLWLTFSTGEAVLLEGLDAMIPEDVVTFVETEPDEAAGIMAEPLTDTPAAAQDSTGNTTVDHFDLATDCIVVTADQPERLSIATQHMTDHGVVITLSTGATITLTGVTAPVDDKAVVFLPSNLPLP